MVSQPPNHGEAITLEWLGETLSHLNVGHTITAFSVSPVGETAGFLGDICRVDLTWSGGEGLPSVIVKFPTVRPDNLETGRGLLAYEREAKFYLSHSEGCSLKPPACHAAVDVSGNGDFLLVIEDLVACRFVSQLDGIDEADAIRAVEGLATMHAQYWNDPTIQASDALYPFSTWADIYPPAIETGWPLYEAHFSYVIDDDLMPYFEAGNEASAAIFNFFAESRPKTLLHGDARMENVCFDPVTGAPRMYDWQLTSTGPAAWDLCYFFAQSLGETEWPDLGERCIAAYFKKLTEEGVANYSEADLRRDLQIASCLLFGFASMVGNFLCPPGEVEKNIVEATTPRFWAVMRHLKSAEVLERLSDFIE